MISLLLSLFIAPAFAQHPPEHQAIHEQFYASWMIPPYRTTSCCNKQDCYPTLFRKEGDQWFAQRREDGAWIRIPKHILEHNQDDSRDSPDSQSHVCMQPPE